jgi:hypothetical protein
MRLSRMYHWACGWKMIDCTVKIPVSINATMTRSRTAPCLISASPPGSARASRSVR